MYKSRKDKLRVSIENVFEQLKLMNDELSLISGEEDDFLINSKIAILNQDKLFKESISTSNADESNPLIQSFIFTFIKEYNLKTKASKKIAQKNKINHESASELAGYRSENKDFLYPIVVKKSFRQCFVDIDDNEYVDMLCSFGSNLFGNNNLRINSALHRQIDRGFEIGSLHPSVSEVSNLINEITGNELTAICNTVSEAVLCAIRIARKVTGRIKIISFKGSYSGIHDEVIVKTADNFIVLDYEDPNSMKKVEELIGEGDVAAILVEPVQFRNCGFDHKKVLKTLRNITKSNKVCLIFDEVISGFRISIGGAQEYFGISADLCIYGKVLGAGMPIGAVSGKKEYMNALDGRGWQYADDSASSIDVTNFAGIFVMQPLAIAAAQTALEILKDAGQKKIDELNSRSQNWVDSINFYCQKVEAPIRFSNFGSLIKPKWLNDKFKYSDLFFAHLRLLGLHQYNGFSWFINLSHTDKDLSFTQDVIKKTIAIFQLNGLMTGGKIELDDSFYLKDEPKYSTLLNIGHKTNNNYI